jgi:hypothetical protein
MDLYTIEKIIRNVAEKHEVKYQHSDHGFRFLPKLAAERDSLFAALKSLDIDNVEVVKYGRNVVVRYLWTIDNERSIFASLNGKVWFAEKFANSELAFAKYNELCNKVKSVRHCSMPYRYEYTDCHHNKGRIEVL